MEHDDLVCKTFSNEFEKDESSEAYSSILSLQVRWRAAGRGQRGAQEGQKARCCVPEVFGESRFFLGERHFGQSGCLSGEGQGR